MCEIMTFLKNDLPTYAAHRALCQGEERQQKHLPERRLLRGQSVLRRRYDRHRRPRKVEAQQHCDVHSNMRPIEAFFQHDQQVQDQLPILIKPKTKHEFK